MVVKACIPFDWATANSEQDLESEALTLPLTHEEVGGEVHYLLGQGAFRRE